MPLKVSSFETKDRHDETKRRDLDSSFLLSFFLNVQPLSRCLSPFRSHSSLSPTVGPLDSPPSHNLHSPSMMTTKQDFIDDGEVASPIEREDCSTSELNITTQLSLPDSFDDSLCLDLYKEFKDNQSQSESKNSATAATDEEPNNGIIHSDLEMKVRELLSTNLELKEKGRLYDVLKQRSTETDAELQELRSQMQHQTSLHDSAIAREKELQNQLLEYKRKNQLLSIDLEFARKETEQAEADKEAIESVLRSTEQKFSRLSAELEQSKWEVSRIREESANEIACSRSQQNEAFARESKLLCDARDQAIEQAKSLQQELSALRTDKESKEAETSDLVQELERQLGDVRSDLRLRSSELNTVQACQERTSAELSKSKEAKAHCLKEYALLERETAKLEEAVRRKDAELQIYHHDDLLVDCDAENVEPNSPGGGFSLGRGSLVKNSVALARKCRELQALLKRQTDELAALHEKNELLSKKEEANRKLFQELSVQNSRNASAYVISAVNARDQELLKLSTKINALQVNLREVAMERDGLSSKLSQTLDRRQELEHVKELVDSMRHRVSIKSTSPHESANHPGHGDDEDLSDHVHHHRSK